MKIFKITNVGYNTNNMANIKSTEDKNKALTDSKQTTTNSINAQMPINIGFRGVYDPSKLKVLSIFTGLKGIVTNGEKSGIGPNYIANENITKVLESILNSKTPASGDLKLALTKMKTVANNFRAFTTGKDIKPISDFYKDTEKFISEMQTNVPILNKTAESVHLSKEEIKFMNSFIAQTAPTLYSMGFDDAIPHAVQVSRKCMIETLKQGGSSVDILQSGLVGWLHDPKFPIAYSWSNLATHPIIASSIADCVLDNPKNKTALFKLCGINKTNKFIRGVSEALLVNNDSDFVLNKVILNKAEFMPNSETGVADIVEGVKDLAQKRFEASQKGEVPPLFPIALRNKMKEVQLETGIKGISTDKLKLIIKELSDKYPELCGDFWQDMMYGEVKDKQLLLDVKNKLEQNGGIIGIKVSSDNLFCHHKEVTNAPLAAKSLIIADPMLLSPHKIIKEGTQKTIIGRIESYCDSFDKNVKNVPLEYLETAKEWQKKVYTSLIKSADELTGNNSLVHINFGNVFSIDEQIKLIKTLINNRTTWGKYADLEPSSGNQGLEKIVSTISKNYTHTAENSSEMFSI